MFLKDNKIHSSEGCQLWVNGVLAAIKHSIWTSETPHSAHPSQKPEEEEELLTYRSSFGTQRFTRGQWSGILHVCLRETDADQSTLLQAGGLSAGFTLTSKLRPEFINSIKYVRGMWTCVINGLVFHRLVQVSQHAPHGWMWQQMLQFGIKTHDHNCALKLVKLKVSAFLKTNMHVKTKT